MSYSEELLSVAEVLEMMPGSESDPTWVTGVTARVKKILSTYTGGSGSPMQIITLQDVDGSALLSMTLFQERPRNFGEGDTIEIYGGGIRRTIYKGLQQITISNRTEIHKIASAPLTQKLPLGEPREPVKPVAPAEPPKTAQPITRPRMSDEDAHMLALFACAARTASTHKTPIWDEAEQRLREWKAQTGR